MIYDLPQEYLVLVSTRAQAAGVGFHWSYFASSVYTLCMAVASG